MKGTLRQKIFAKLLNKEEATFEPYYENTRKELLNNVKGNVLEIGPGTGVNLPYYNKHTKWTGIEPNTYFHKDLRKKAKKLGLKITLQKGFSEHLKNIKNNSQDYVVSTLVLCSVTNLEQTLNEIKRVLKKKGTFIFLEHVKDSQNSWRRLLQKMQRFTPWRFFGDGCNPARNIEEAIRQAEFSKVQLITYEQETPGIIAWIVKPHIKGYAKK